MSSDPTRIIDWSDDTVEVIRVWPFSATDVASLRRDLASMEWEVADFKTSDLYKQNVDRFPWLKDL